jgi:hypothetical protein
MNDKELHRYPRATCTGCCHATNIHWICVRDVLDNVIVALALVLLQEEIALHWSKVPWPDRKACLGGGLHNRSDFLGADM